MTNKNFFILYFASTCLFCLILSCNTKSSELLVSTKDSINNFSQHQVHIEEIPLHISQAYGYGKLKEDEINLGLKKFDPEKDSISIRFWFGIGLITRSVLIIENVNSKWIANWVVFKEIHTETKKTEFSDISSYNKKPKSGWNFLLNEIVSKGVLSLSDNDSGGGGDGISYDVEIYTKKHHRYYSFFCPYSSENKSQHINQFIQTLEILVKEFGLEIEKC